MGSLFQKSNEIKSGSRNLLPAIFESEALRKPTKSRGTVRPLFLRLENNWRGQMRPFFYNMTKKILVPKWRPLWGNHIFTGEQCCEQSSGEAALVGSCNREQKMIELIPPCWPWGVSAVHEVDKLFLGLSGEEFGKVWPTHDFVKSRPLNMIHDNVKLCL